VIANARLSERSLKKARRLDALMRPAVATLADVLAQTAADAERLHEAGAPHVQVCGNLKFDLQPEPALLARGAAWRAAGAPRPVVLAASWREGEDEPLLAAWVDVLARWRGPAERRPRLLLVPRHPQRFDEVAAMVLAHGLSLSRRGGWGDGAVPADAAACDVWLGDSMREMPAYYALADIALLGGSYAPLGGQNLIEAAACGCPVVMGPHTFNFAEAALLAEQAGAAQRVADLPAGIALAMARLDDAARLAAMVAASRDYAAQHQGAARRMAEAVMNVMSRQAGAGPITSPAAR
jgi:3-deoxy-D-manno-octulosonic-acid transferase